MTERLDDFERVDFDDAFRALAGFAYAFAIGAPNQHCDHCRREGLCWFHRDWPHNIRQRKNETILDPNRLLR